MARLQKDEREDRENSLYRLLRRLRFGVRESEVAEELDTVGPWLVVLGVSPCIGRED